MRQKEAWILLACLMSSWRAGLPGLPHYIFGFLLAIRQCYTSQKCLLCHCRLLASSAAGRLLQEANDRNFILFCSVLNCSGFTILIISSSRFLQGKHTQLDLLSTLGEEPQLLQTALCSASLQWESTLTFSSR